MERTKKAVELITWKKLGGGSVYLKNRIIKPGQVFQATVDEIPVGARDVIVPVDAVEMKKADPKAEVLEKADLEYFLNKRSAGYYDVVDAEGKVQNEKALREGPAKELIETLMG